MLDISPQPFLLIVVAFSYSRTILVHVILLLVIHTMSSSEDTNIEREAVLVQISLYKQMRQQLLAKIELYKLQEKVELAIMISESIK
jgi:hypothetical protein